MKIALAAMAAALLPALASSANAVPIQCAKHNQMVGLLSEKYSENPVAMGTVNSDRYMQLFVSREGTWTILVTKTDGQACIVAAGNNWEKLPSLVEADPAA
jgi:hypothetical protein